MKQLEGKVAVVTGGNSGIGLSTAKLFKAEGARVFITASSAKTFDVAVKELGQDFEIIQADVSIAADTRKLANEVRAKAGRVDVIFANAGISIIKPTDEFPEDDYDRVFDINTKGVFLTVQSLAPLLTDHASVVVNASRAATMGFPGGSVYGASKAAIRTFARMWAVEYAARRIRFNVVSPSLTETPIIKKFSADEAQKQAFLSMAEQTPAGRIAQPEEIAEAVLFLVSSKSSYVNGVELFIDGGGLMSL